MPEVKVTQLTVTYDNCTSAADLQLQLRSSEGDIKLKALKFLDTGMSKTTLGTFEVTNENMTLRKLRVVLDPDSAQQPKDGEEQVCKGTACIGLEKKKVAVFRPKAA